MCYNSKNIVKIAKNIAKKKKNAEVIKKRGKRGLCKKKMRKMPRSRNRIFPGGLINIIIIIKLLLPLLLLL